MGSLLYLLKPTAGVGNGPHECRAQHMERTVLTGMPRHLLADTARSATIVPIASRRLLITITGAQNFNISPPLTPICCHQNGRLWGRDPAPSAGEQVCGLNVARLGEQRPRAILISCGTSLDSLLVLSEKQQAWRH